MPLTQSDMIEVKRVTGKGRGVFARRRIRAGEVIERVPVLVFPIAALDDAMDGPGLDAYCFLWSRSTVALALGYGSLYNHSYRPNATYDDEGRRTKVFKALRDIPAGEEITVNYNGDPNDLSPVGFKVIDDGRARRAASARRAR
jgi:SET domain-containing protein